MSGKVFTFEMRRDWIRLERCENVGPATFKTLLAVYGTPTEALEHLSEFALKGGRTKPLKVPSLEAVTKEMEAVEQMGGTMLCLGEEGYPTLLSQIPDAPPVLTVLGDRTLLKKKMIGMVGTRNASLNGKNYARRMALDFALKDYVVVSGMAKGIDAAAHTGALEAPPQKGGTLAVLGTGVDEIYPLENRELYHALIERGAIVSELPLSSKPFAGQFPRRNRIISGLSRAVLVIEAQMSSGSLITAHLAKEQKRSVFAVPGFPADPRSQGTNHLIKSGIATLAESAADIIEKMEEDLFHGVKDAEDRSPLLPLIQTDENELQTLRPIVEENLSSDPVLVDDLIRETKIPASFLNVILSELELADKLVRYPGNRVALIM